MVLNNSHSFDSAINYFYFCKNYNGNLTDFIETVFSEKSDNDKKQLLIIFDNFLKLNENNYEEFFPILINKLIIILEKNNK